MKTLFRRIVAYWIKTYYESFMAQLLNGYRHFDPKGRILMLRAFVACFYVAANQEGIAPDVLFAREIIAHLEAEIACDQSYNQELIWRNIVAAMIRKGNTDRYIMTKREIEFGSNLEIIPIMEGNAVMIRDVSPLNDRVC